MLVLCGVAVLDCGDRFSKQCRFQTSAKPCIREVFLVDFLTVNKVVTPKIPPFNSGRRYSSVPACAAIESCIHPASIHGFEQLLSSVC